VPTVVRPAAGFLILQRDCLQRLAVHAEQLCGCAAVATQIIPAGLYLELDRIEGRAGVLRRSATGCEEQWRKGQAEKREGMKYGTDPTSG